MEHMRLQQGFIGLLVALIGVLVIAGGTYVFLHTSLVVPPVAEDIIDIPVRVATSTVKRESPDEVKVNATTTITASTTILVATTTASQSSTTTASTTITSEE